MWFVSVARALSSSVDVFRGCLFRNLNIVSCPVCFANASAIWLSRMEIQVSSNSRKSGYLYVSSLSFLDFLGIPVIILSCSGMWSVSNSDLVSWVMEMSHLECLYRFWLTRM